jgi:hypothetical protein
VEAVENVHPDSLLGGLSERKKCGKAARLVLGTAAEEKYD